MRCGTTLLTRWRFQKSSGSTLIRELFLWFSIPGEQERWRFERPRGSKTAGKHSQGIDFQHYPSTLKLKAGLPTVEQVDFYNFISTDKCACLQGSWPSLCLAIGQVCTCRATDRLRIRIFWGRESFVKRIFCGKKPFEKKNLLRKRIFWEKQSFEKENLLRKIIFWER